MPKNVSQKRLKKSKKTKPWMMRHGLNHCSSRSLKNNAKWKSKRSRSTEIKSGASIKVRLSPTEMYERWNVVTMPRHFFFRPFRPSCSESSFGSCDFAMNTKTSSRPAEHLPKKREHYRRNFRIDCSPQMLNLTVSLFDSPTAEASP